MKLKKFVLQCVVSAETTQLLLKRLACYLHTADDADEIEKHLASVYIKLNEVNKNLKELLCLLKEGKYAGE